MKSVIAILFTLFAISSWSYATTITSAKYTDDTQQTISIQIGKETKKFSAPEGKFWKHLIVSKNRKTAFFVLHRGHPQRGAWTEDLHKYSIAQEVDTAVAIPLKTNLDRATVMEIFDVTNDGSRLLIELHYSHKKDGNSTFYRTYPYFLNTNDGSISPVRP